MTVLVMGCESSPSGVTENENNNNNGDDTEEVTEPSFSISNLENGAEVSGELTFSIDGEAEDGFSELRILLGEEQVASASDPAMPYEQTLKTFGFDNGDQELTVELDVTGEDTTVTETVSVYFENYLMSIDMDGYIRSTIDNSEYFNLYISDPEGNILETTDLSGDAGMVGLAPPEAIDGEAPEYFNVTIAVKYEGSSNVAYTYTGLESWATVWDGFESNSSTSTTEFDKELRVEISNPSFNPWYWGAVSKGTDHYNSYRENETYPVSLSVSSEANNLLSYMIPFPDAEDNIPWYHWEKDLQSLELSNENTIHYDATTDFKKMSVFDIAHSSDLEVTYYELFMSADADSWSSGSLWIPLLGSASQYDQNSSGSVYGMAVPESDHLFDLRMMMHSKSNPNVLHQIETDNALPDKFQTVDADVDGSGLQNFSDVTLDFTGSFDFARLQASHANSDEQNDWAWIMLVSDSMESFSPPKITEEFNWELFDILAVEMVIAGGLDGYEDYMRYLWSDSDLSINSSKTKLVTFDSQSKRKMGNTEGFKPAIQPKPLMIDKGQRHPEIPLER